MCIVFTRFGVQSFKYFSLFKTWRSEEHGASKRIESKERFSFLHQRAPSEHVTFTFWERANGRQDDTTFERRFFLSGERSLEVRLAFS